MKSMCDYIRRTSNSINKIEQTIDLYSKNVVDYLHNSNISKVYLVGSGTSLNAACMCEQICADILQIPCIAVAAMHFVDCINTIGKNTLVIGISQAGRSTSTIKALEKAMKSGCYTIAVSAENDALIKKYADSFLLIDMENEDIGPKTEGYYCSVISIILLILKVGVDHNVCLPHGYNLYLSSINACADKFNEIMCKTIKWANENEKKLKNANDIIVIGSGNCLPAATEGALKILETIRCCVRSYETEEFMHGIYHAINKNTLILGIANDDSHYERTMRLLNFLREEKGASVIAITNKEANYEIPAFIYPFDGNNKFVSLEYLVFFQTLAQFMAEDRNIDYDRLSDPGFHRIMESYTY